MSERPTRRRRGAPLHHDPAALTYAREQAGLTKRELAHRCGFSEQLMCDIEAGRRSATPHKLKQIAAALNCPPVVLEAKRAGVPDLMPSSGETGGEKRQAEPCAFGADESATSLVAIEPAGRAARRAS